MLNGKIAIVTGGARNIGKAIAKALWENGATVVIADFDSKAGEDTAAEIGERVDFVETDITKETDLDHLVEVVLNKYQKIDILVNNAGVQLNRDTMLEMKDSDYDLTMNINLRGMVLLTKKVVTRYMKQAGYGKIINTASMCGTVFYQFNFAYTVSKGAVKAFTSQAAAELAEFGITVNAIGPGYINTEMNREAFATSSMKNEICSKIPMKRVGETDELGGPVVFFASDASSYVTGQTLIIDGGYTLL